MSACCAPDCRNRADVMVSVPSYQQEACWEHIRDACDTIDRNNDSYVTAEFNPRFMIHGPYTITRLKKEPLDV